jgi:hypothetical protein
MKSLRIILLLPALGLLATLPVPAQFGQMIRPPSVQGVWNPVVGTGAAYEVTDNQQKKNTLEITVVGKESVNGQDAYWMETGVQDPKSHNTIYMKMLIAQDKSNIVTERFIVQVPGQPNPMEMSMNMAMTGTQGSSQSSDIRERAERIGSETITVPAGTFVCEHYRVKDGSGDVWFAPKISPWGLIKFVGKDSSMVLLKQITDAKDHITGTPIKFDPTQMMHP